MVSIKYVLDFIMIVLMNTASIIVIIIMVIIMIIMTLSIYVLGYDSP